jgi:phenylalanyl-tRNA synthetase beta chain
VKGVIEAIVAELNPEANLEAAAWRHPLLEEARSCELRLDGRRLGFLGEVNAAGVKEFGLRGTATLAELQLAELHHIARLIPTYRPLSTQQPITRDLNFIVAEAVRWSDLASTVRRSAGPDLERIEFREEFRDPKKDGPGRKRLFFSYTIRPAEKTLTSDEAESIQQAIIAACGKEHHAAVVG